MKKVGILRGGTGWHYGSSLKKGGEIILFINENLGEKYKPVDILVDKDYIWHLAGVPVIPSDLVHKVDIVWNLSHPSFSNILESLNIPNIGPSSFSSMLTNNKDTMREHMKQIGVEMPRNVIAPKNAREVFEKFGAPWIVSNNNEARVVKTFDELAGILNGDDSFIVEEFIPGKVASVHSVPNFRGADIYTFPFGNAYGNFSEPEREKLIGLVRDMHSHLGAEHYLKSDFVLGPRGKVYLLQIEPHPDIKPDSHFAQVCDLAGTKMQDVVEYMLESAV